MQERKQSCSSPKWKIYQFLLQATGKKEVTQQRLKDVSVKPENWRSLNFDHDSFSQLYFLCQLYRTTALLHLLTWFNCILSPPILQDKCSPQLPISVHIISAHLHRKITAGYPHLFKWELYSPQAEQEDMEPQQSQRQKPAVWTEPSEQEQGWEAAGLLCSWEMMAMGKKSHQRVTCHRTLLLLARL